MVFETATPFETAGWMRELVSWFNRSIEEETQHPLILIGVFIVVFLAIHPFKDGNGRLSRVLTTLLLLRAGYGYVPYSSMESIIERNKDNYYLTLRRTQQTIRKEEQNWEPWLVFFLKTMAKQKDNLAEKVKEEHALRASLPALSRQILELVKTRGEITVKEIEESTGANRNTIKVHVKKLAEQQYLQHLGQGRGARYMIKYDHWEFGGGAPRPSPSTKRLRRDCKVSHWPDRSLLSRKLATCPSIGTFDRPP